MKSRLLTIILICLLFPGCGNSRPENTGPEIILPTNGLPEGSKTIVFAGDSLTSGMSAGMENAFPAMMQKYFNEKKIPYKTENYGVPYITTADLLERIDGNLSNRNDICLVIVQIGGNDTDNFVPAEQTYKNLEGIIQKILNRGIPCFLIDCSYITDDPDLQKFYAKYNNIFYDLARKYNLGKVFVFNDEIVKNSDKWPDRIHPDSIGHKIMAGLYLKRLNPAWSNAYNSIHY
jgi:acyl-CoA thioesterase-1